MDFQVKKCNADLIVVGAGLAGICAAVQAARAGVKVALINDRGVLGGNSSAEIGVFINGANDGGQLNLNAREGGIVSEIMLDYKYRSPSRTNALLVDGVFLDFVYRETNIQLFLNTCIDSAKTETGSVISVTGTQNTTETRWEFNGRWFVDNTGDGTLGALAGAEYMMGREARSTFSESIANEEADHYVLPSTLAFTTKDVGYKVSYVAPDFAFNIPASGILERRDVKGLSMKWYYEIGGEYDHVKDREDIIRDHKKLVFGIWDYLKNSGEYSECDNYDFDFISTIPGTREYRRLVGDYILTENDIREQRDFEDTVGHGGWNIDLHAIKGIFDEDLVNRHIHFNGIYKIPYRVCYSKNIKNLFMCGRCMSASHVALGSARVMATLATIGQAVGMASGLCKKYNVNPKDIYTEHIKELQQSLLKVDQLVVGVKNEDETDLAKTAKVMASSTAKLELAEPANIDFEARLQARTPQFRTRYKTMCEKFSDIRNLDDDMGIMVPTIEQLETLQICVKNRSETTLNYQVFLPEKKENYGPDQLIAEGAVEIKSNTDFKWIDIPVNAKVREKYVFVILKKNEMINMAVGGDALPTTSMLISHKNTNPSVVSLSTLEMAEVSWHRSSISVCFKTIPEQKVYEASNVINGYNRAYGVPNMWLSEYGSEQTLTLKWEEAKAISRLQITFAIDTTKRFYFECDTKVFDLIGEDYDVYAMVAGKEVLVKSIEKNYKKVNYLSFNQVKTDEIKIKFRKASSNQIGIYEVRAYE